MDEIQEVEKNKNIQANEKNDDNNGNNVFKLLKPKITEETMKIAIPIAVAMAAIYTCTIFGL